MDYLAECGIMLSSNASIFFFGVGKAETKDVDVS